MMTEFRNYIDSIADEIIALSLTLDKEIETWNDVIARVPESSSKDLATGFVSKPVTNSTIEIVIDVQAPRVEETARIRIWAIQTIKDTDGDEHFNNIQLTYTLDHATGRKLVEQTNTPTRSDFSTLIHEPSTNLESITVSDTTDTDGDSVQEPGKRYDLETEDLLTMDEDLKQSLILALNNILDSFKKIS